MGPDGAKISQNADKMGKDSAKKSRLSQDEAKMGQDGAKIRQRWRLDRPKGNPRSGSGGHLKGDDGDRAGDLTVCADLLEPF